MIGFLDIVSVVIVILGIIYMICCITTLINIKRKRIDKKEISKVYSYIIIVAILYILFWLSLKIQQ